MDLLDPLDQSGIAERAIGGQMAELSAPIEASTALALGRALDVGCGTGTKAVYL